MLPLPILERLTTAQDAQAAAEALLECLPTAPDGVRVLRTMLHRRTDAGYLGLCARSPVRRGAEDSFEPTSSMWRWLKGSPRGLVLDVLARRVIPLGRPEAAHDNAIPDAISEGSQRILSDRRAGCVVILPLPALGGGLAGLLSVELADPGVALGTWPAELRDAAAVAAPWILGLPARSSVRASSLLPVVGRQMEERLGVLQSLARYADNLLLRGETGTGKTQLARWLHANSRWSKGPFIEVALGSTNPKLLTGELYGWARGAHSEARSARAGRVAAAEGGTLFLDEIGDLDADGQLALLQLLDRRPTLPLGADVPGPPPRLGIVMATHRDLEAAVRARTFREDLLHRIGTTPIELPPLRERRDEIRAWAEHFISQRAQNLRAPTPTLSSSVIERWEAAPWPGNLRELDRAAERALALCLGRSSAVIELVDLPPARAPDVVSALRSAGAEMARAIQEGHAEIGDADVFRSYVLDAVLDDDSTPAEAFRKLGQEALVESRNHTAELKKLRNRRRRFEGRLRGGPDTPGE